MATGVDLAALLGADHVDWALGHAAVHHRFADADLGSILAYHTQLRPGTPRGTWGAGPQSSTSLRPARSTPMAA